MTDNTDLFEKMRAAPVRVKKRREPLPAGHADRPGTGLAGETCGSCKHLYRNRQAKTYLKCALTRACWTGGRKTDVRAKDAACSKWAPATGSETADAQSQQTEPDQEPTGAA